MFDQLVLATVFASLSSIGLWHSIPLTGINPSNSFFWRSLNSLEIAYSIHTLRQVHPYVFPNDDAVSQHDLLLQLQADAQQYENARLALQQSAEAVSLQVNIPGVTVTTLDPSATAMTTSVYLNDDSAAQRTYEELHQFIAAQDSSVYYIVMAVLVLAILTIQVMGFGMLYNVKSQVEDMQYDYFARMGCVQEQFHTLMLEIREFRRENGQVRHVFVQLAESIRDSSADVQHCLLHLVGVMEDKYTSGMITMESKLDEVSQQHQTLMRNTESFPQIPRQLAWLNILMAKNLSDDLPDPGVHLEQPNLDLRKSKSSSTNGASNNKTARQTNAVSTSEGAMGLKNGKGGVVQSNGQGLT
ncbi:unnamed protein product [Penicillium nalgiovense]|uniref:Fungal N-terminal domain-containing protein n=1 Tax=Penicillium nalgiovense TaxID=60175 RepID=A0A1V6YSB0_PENNA|nr:hypothetical protein PENNAL_c0012G00172 [Penicillium nalgiovense]CAG8000997.1 unnamed protein product [Penicillium nalgiovense]CAG8030429.1 unnamed protein product [Penicillium nalgiovense]CAG8060873.1 unnamed protein product [Penicillium nalgiovense]CAG8075332.1 unnamed protein product [Penicillium nalgiovense]